MAETTGRIIVMKALLQRVDQAAVMIDGRVTGKIDQGLVVLLGVAAGDGEKDADYLFDKILNMRIFNDEESKFNRSLLQIGGGLLVISQFTLLADTRHGRRPSFSDAEMPEKAEALYNYFMNKVKGSGLQVASGIFAAHMKVNLTNDGPVTIMIDSKDRVL